LEAIEKKPTIAGWQLENAFVLAAALWKVRDLETPHHILYNMILW
jgi:hypothetical protein